jgi:hypothetical protein
MADYYPLIVRAVTGLDKGTGEARRALYERARAALVTQLRGVQPALSEADITRERLALEEAIRKVEAEAARRPRPEGPKLPRANLAPLGPSPEKPASFAPRPPPPDASSAERAPPPARVSSAETPPPPPGVSSAETPPPPPEVSSAETPPPAPEVRSAETPPPDWDEVRKELDNFAPPPQLEGSEVSERETAARAEPPPAPSGDEPSLPFEPQSRPDHAAAPEPASASETASPSSEAPPPEPWTSSPGTKFSSPRRSLVDDGLEGFRHVVAQRDDRGEATASATRPERDARDAGPPLSNTVERREPRFRPENLRPSEQGLAPSSPRAEPRAGRLARPAPPPPDPEEFDEPEEQPLRRGRGGAARKIIALAVVVVLGAAAFFAYLEWGGGTTGVIQSGRSPATQASKEAPRPKISDRIGGAQQQDQAARTARDTGAAVAQRAVLYEQQADPQERKQYVGSVIWRTETTSPGPGQPADVAVRAEVEIPERHMRMNFIVRRNLDESLPASHTIEVLFSTPADFQPGGVADVPAVLMEDNDQRSGAPLTGLRVKVSSGFFLVGLSSVEHDLKRNVQLLKERPWVHIRMAYNNGQRALLAIEKGVPGDRVFEEALNTWGQSPPPQPSR